MLSPEDLRDDLRSLRDLLPALERLLAAPQRELITTTQVSDTSRVRDPCADRMMELLTQPGALHLTESVAPHLRLDGASFRFQRLIERRRLIVLDVPANRVLHRALQSAAFALGRHLRRHDLAGDLLDEVRALRSAVLALLPPPSSEPEDRVGPMRPADLLDRTLRYAPRYQPVLALYSLARRLRKDTA